MKKHSIYILLILFINTTFGQLNSPLKPVGFIVAPKTFSEKSHNFFISKKFKIATNQRDSFFYIYYNLLKAYTEDTSRRSAEFKILQDEYSKIILDHNGLLKDFAKLNEDYKDLSGKLTEFMDSSTSKEKKYNMSLAQKNKELDLKDKELNKKDKELLEREKKLKELEAITLKQDSISRALKELIKSALLGFNNNDLSVDLKNGKVYISFSDEFLFESGKADVKSAGLEAIKKVAEVINKNIKIDILIEGHTDNIPMKSAKFQDNWELSAGRAISVVKLLSNNYGVLPIRLTAAGRGEFAPRESNETAIGRAKNRRVEIILIPDLSELYKIIYK